MAVQRYDLNLCIGCKNCITVCPMDVFRFDEEANKSVIAYPENCQGCAQCYVGCLGRSLEISWYETRYGINAARAVATDATYRETVEANIVATLYETDDSSSSSGSSWSS